MREFLLCLLLLAGLSLSIDVRAEEPDAKKSELKATQAQLAASQQRSDRLKKNLADMQKTLSDIQQSTGSIAAALQQDEAQRRDIESRLEMLKQQQAQKQGAIDQHRQQVGAMLASAIRLDQVPPYAVFAMQGGLENEVHASRALTLTASALREELDRLGKEVAEIERLKRQTAADQMALSAKDQELKIKRDSLGERIDERKKMVSALFEANQKEQQRVAALSKKSSDLESLVSSLEADRKKKIDREAAERQQAHEAAPETPAAERQQAHEAAPETPAAEQTPKPGTPAVRATGPRKEYDLAKARGNLRLPATGQLIESFGTRRGQNDTLRGMLLGTAQSAVVTSPYGGEVLFTGPFLDYGQMVIIRHSRQYHTLLAGLSRIDVAPGQFLLEGEPIGVMGNGKDERRLYIELREAGKPIDPAPWFRGFGRFARK